MKNSPPFYFHHTLLAQQEIQNIHAGVGFCPIQLGITTLVARNCNKPLILDIKQLCKAAARRLELIGHIMLAAALGANKLLLFHIIHFLSQVAPATLSTL